MRCHAQHPTMTAVTCWRDSHEDGMHKQRKIKWLDGQPLRTRSLRAAHEEALDLIEGLLSGHTTVDQMREFLTKEGRP